MNNIIRCSLIILSFLISFSVNAEMSVPVQLRLKAPSGTYPTSSGLSFKLLILSPASNCVLREEDFSGQTITNGNISLQLGTGVRGVLDPSLSLAQVYDNSKSRTGLTCVDANNNVTLTGQTYNPAADDSRVIRVTTNIGGDNILVNFNMRATPYAVQAESVGGKMAADIVVNDTSSQMNQANLNNLLLDVTHFNNLKNFASSGVVSSAANFTGALAGDVSGNQGSTSVDKIKGIAVSSTAPTSGQVLVYNGAQYVPQTPASAPVTSVAGRTGAVSLSSSDVSGLGNSAGLNVGTVAGTVAAGDDARITAAFADTSAATSANTANTIVKRDASGYITVSNVSSTNNSTNNLYLYDGANSVRVKAPVGLPASYVLTLPADDGANGQVLQTDGSGNLTWANAGGGGSVNSVTASAPLASSGGVNPNISLSQSNGTTDGYLSSADWATFNSKQNALGFTPLDVAAYNADVAGASACTSTQTSYWNTVSDMWSCQNISFPADLVTSVAGRTGAVTLSSSDISGLGNTAGLNIGTVAGTVAAGDDSRIVNAVQTSTAHSGDVTGVYNVLSVNRIRGVAVSATAPIANQVLQYNGSQYVPTTLSFGSVNSVTASAPLSSSGGTNPDISMSQANATTNGYLSSSDWSTFNGKQNALGFTPLNPANNLSDLSNTTTARGNLGLGTAAVLNVGVAANNVVQLDAGAKLPTSTLPSSVVTTASGFSGDVSGTSTTISVNRIRGVDVSNSVPNNGDVLQYNGSQYVPVAIPSAPVSSVAGRTGAVTLASSDISGLGNSAGRNVGTVAGTVAAGDDSRITGALQTSAYNTDVGGASGCTSTQTSYWNTVSDMWSCQNISFPADLVTSVAGRTGAVTLSSSDISGLGNSAGLNIGTVAGTVAAGDDSRIVNAVQTSTAHSGDVSGTYNTISVDKIKGRTISSTAPTAGQALVYNGTDWVPTTGFPFFSRKTANQTFSVTGVANVTSMSFAVTAGNTYKYKFSIAYTSGATTTGLRVGLTYPAATMATALANIASGADGTGAYFQGLINTSGDSVMAANSPSSTATLYAQVEGMITPSASGTVQLQAASETNGVNIVILANSFVEVTQIP